MFHGHYWKVTLLYFLLGFLLCERTTVSGRTGVGESSGGDYAQHSRQTRSASRPTPATLEQEESLRKEIIKAQILQRLGLSEKPHVDIAHKISKDLVLETLRRTEYLDQNAPHDQTRHSQHNSTDEDSQSNFAKTSEIIAFPDKGPVLNGHTLLSFSYAGNNAYGVGVRVKRAHLWVKMEFSSSIGRHFGHLLHPKGVNLYIFLVNGNYSNKVQSHHHQPVHLSSQEVNLELVTSRTILLDSLGWQKLDISAVVQKWYNKQSRHRVRHANSPHSKNHRDKLTLLVDCSGCGHSIHPITFSQSNTVISEKSLDEDEGKSEVSNEAPSSSSSSKKRHHQSDSVGHENQGEMSKRHHPTPPLRDDPDDFHSNMDNLTELPFLVLETESAPNFKRSRRKALECSARVKQCCKAKLYVSFRELMWDDWIIAPTGYWADYCRGPCQKTPDTFLNYHRVVLDQYRKTAEGQANLDNITPCCAPVKLKSMSIIYFGPDMNIIKRDLPNMIVEECGCP